ncbi:T9SS type A sorting domain-containing protein [Carboxylicivirga mesophila]|uniref:T9SS type A sorting domain-containing protein n=1 Tax=Carboxylicivirga mesophila TaxID=1166478 RepID=A0ABS5KCP3_9BACT|nr:T9SS type A sorting domain-containing protein [Carboxylicivirga mesophila]MBS2212814.1 T9SS type A sorting domain-containing protein [Carboxylicivirga mesophila]
MRNNYFIKKMVFLGVIWLMQTVLCEVTALDITTSQTVSGPLTYNELVTVVDNGNPNDTVIYIVEGDFTCMELTVEVNTIMVVKGDLVIGDVNQNNVDFQVYGTLVVSGSLDVRGKNSLELNIETTGVLAVGGSYDYTGKNGGATEDNAGQLFLSDPDDFTGSGNGSGDLGDLIEAGVLPPDIEDTFIDNVDETLFTTATWNGGSSQWDLDSNWTNTDTPTTGDNVLIESGKTFYPQFCAGSEYFMWNLELEAGTELTIPQGSKVTVLGDITIGAGANLVVENSNSAPSSFIVYGDVLQGDGITPADITFRWTYNSGNWWFIGHPISNALMTISYDNILLTNGGTNDYVLYDYQDPDVLSKISKTNKDFSGESSIKGYLFKVKDDNTLLEMTGQVNNDAEYSKALQTEWQVIANPYPSYYQLPLEDAADINADFYHTTGTVYVTESTRNSDKTYSTYNTLTGISSPSNTLVNGIIAPGQAFYVKTSTAGNIKMRSANRVHAVGTQLKSTTRPKETDVLRIKIENESGGVDEAVLAFRQDGQCGFSRLDSEQRFTTNSLSYVYSVIEGNKAVINVLPRIEEDWQQTIGINSKQGLHKVYLEGLETLTTELEVLLEDKNKKEFTNLDGQTVYEFSTEEGSFDERFVLHLNIPAVATDIDIADWKAYDAKVYLQNNSELVIEHDWDEPQVTVMIYGISGELVFQEGVVGRKTVKSLVLSTGMYIVKLIGREHTFEQKVMIK